MPLAAREVSEIPKEVMNVLETQPIGYLSVKSDRGEIFSYPVVFVITGIQLYLITPISSAKLRFMRSNPDVSFLVYNKDVTLGAVGAMIQGRAKFFSIAKTVLNILSVGPNMVKYTQKYPGRFTFYARGKQLPDERKLYKYRIVRIDPTKILFWVGYKFGKYAKKVGKGDALAKRSDDEKMEAIDTLLRAADEEFAPGEVPPPGDEWAERVEEAVKTGVISEEERQAMGSFRGFLRQAAEQNKVGHKVTADEKGLLKKWKSSSN